jgi:RimJ/RimL family protein N-acetyltransferase
VDAETTPVLRGERAILRPLEEADIPRLAAILREEEVARWWGDDGAVRHSPRSATTASPSTRRSPTSGRSAPMRQSDPARSG